MAEPVLWGSGIDSCLGYRYRWNAGKGCWSRSGTVTVGLLRLGDGRLEPTGGREDNVGRTKGVVRVGTGRALKGIRLLVVTA